MSSAAPLSEAQLAANRRNAEHSTGPRTDAGKTRSRLNGLRHGLTGQTVVMPDENLQAYEVFRAEIAAIHQPEGPAEQALVQSIADESWRLNRARAIEENIFALGAATETSGASPQPELDAALNQARTFLDYAREIQLLTVYAGRIARTLEKRKAELRALQLERKQAREQALEEALLLAHLAESKGETYNPAPDFPGFGFGFSASEIARLLHRNRRLELARQLLKSSRRAPRKAA